MPACFFKPKIFFKLINILVVILIMANAFIIVTDSALVSMWGTKINTKALSYLYYPYLLSQSFLSVRYVVLVSFFILLSVSTIIFYFKFVQIKGEFRIKKIAVLLFIPIILVTFTMVRGGWGNNPIAKNRGVYSDNITLNLATVNGFWNFLSVIIKKVEINIQYFDFEVAEKTVKNYYEVEKDTTISILTTQRPNIVLIMLESFGAENMMKLGGKQPVAPKLDSLAEQGILFTNFYAAGSRTEQGMVALLSGFPATPMHSVQRNASKVFNLPMVSRSLKNVGYELNFYYGGYLDYARTNEYLETGLFDNVYDKTEFSKMKQSYMGAYDEDLFQFQLDKSVTSKQPFFSAFLTSSTHVPYDGDFNQLFWTKTGESNDYKNAVHYSDSCVVQYIELAKKYDWYKNTLFVLIADHVNSLSNERDYNEPLSYKIPLILYGEVIKPEFRGKQITKPAGQFHLPATLLAQLGLDYSKFEFSTNLFNPYAKSFAYYAFDNGFGIIGNNDTIVFDNSANAIISKHTKLKNDSTLNLGKSFLQIYMQRFSEME